MHDASLAQAWDHAANQFAAYRGFSLDYAGYLDEQAAAIDAILSATEGVGIPDQLLLSDPHADAATWKATGFDAETVTYYQAMGLSEQEIAALLQNLIAQLEATPQTASYVSFYDEIKAWRDAARTLVTELRQQFAPITQQMRQQGPATFTLDPMQAQFEVGNPTASKATVELLVRPINLPLNWTYHLDQAAVELDPGEVTTVTLTLASNTPMLEETEVQVAVEGYIGTDFIGGITFSRRTPKYLVEPVDFKYIYLPMVLK
jgi:hypothetical protein